MRRRAFSRAFVVATMVLASCGARTGLIPQEAGPRPPQCVTDADCDDALFCTGIERCVEEACVPGAPVVCTDGDACTSDLCSESTRGCTHAPLTRDADGDGYPAPRAGFRPGAPDSCGTDCNDRDASIHPGATEVCNGVDDDCNGVIDDGAIFTPVGGEVRVSTPDMSQDGPGGLAWSGANYLATYGGRTPAVNGTPGAAHVYSTALDATGMVDAMNASRRVTLAMVDAFGGHLAWNGTVAGIAWEQQVTNEGNYEVYFNRLRADGQKVGPDERITFADAFSINPTVAWTGSEFVVAWQDARNGQSDGTYDVYAQRIDADGRQIEDNKRLVRNATSPVLAVSDTASLGLAYLASTPGGTDNTVRFATYTSTLQALGTPSRVSPDGQLADSPALAFSRDRWVLAWNDADPLSVDHEVWGATRDAGGLPLTVAQRLTNDANFSRYPELVPLGDRVLLVWSDNRGGNGYDLWASTFATDDLHTLVRASRITSAPRDAAYPIAVQGPRGDVGILYRALRDGGLNVYFTRLECALDATMR